MCLFQPIIYEYNNSQALWSPKKTLKQFWESSAASVIEEQVSSVMDDLEGQLASVSAQLQIHVDQVEQAVEQMHKQMEHTAQAAHFNEEFVK